MENRDEGKIESYYVRKVFKWNTVKNERIISSDKTVLMEHREVRKNYIWQNMFIWNREKKESLKSCHRFCSDGTPKKKEKKK